MRTTELKEQLAKFGMKSIKRNGFTEVFDKDKTTVAIISGKDVGMINTIFEGYQILDIGRKGAIDLILRRYSFTPIDLREKEVYYVKFTSEHIKDYGSYLNFSTVHGGYTFANELENIRYKTRFTEAELEGLPDDIKSMIQSKILKQVPVDENE